MSLLTASSHMDAAQKAAATVKLVTAHSDWWTGFVQNLSPSACRCAEIHYANEACPAADDDWQL